MTPSTFVQVDWGIIEVVNRGDIEDESGSSPSTRWLVNQDGRAGESDHRQSWASVLPMINLDEELTTIAYDLNNSCYDIVPWGQGVCTSDCHSLLVFVIVRYRSSSVQGVHGQY